MKLTCQLCGKNVEVVPSRGDYSAFLKHHRDWKTNMKCVGSGMSEGAAKVGQSRGGSKYVGNELIF